MPSAPNEQMERPGSDSAQAIVGEGLASEEENLVQLSEAATPYPSLLW